jgi:hypothetical protein
MKGFVYILINPSIPRQIKIGTTTKTSEERANRLSSHPSVPTPFVVVYDELVSNCKEVEKRLHKKFSAYRVNRNREFFNIPIKEAIKALQKEAAGYPIQQIKSSQEVEMLPQLQERYKTYLKPDIVSTKLVQLESLCFLEITRQKWPHPMSDQIIDRIDLSFIAVQDGPMFCPEKTPAENARAFLEQLDEYDLIWCTSLFTEDACKKIAKKWEKNLFPKK